MAPSSWRVLSSLAAEGTSSAADEANAIGSLPVAATLRQVAAERLVVDGRAAEPRERLERSLDLWRSVDAARYIEGAERMLVPACMKVRRLAFVPRSLLQVIDLDGVFVTLG
jgi:hypothetical protein